MIYNDLDGLPSLGVGRNVIYKDDSGNLDYSFTRYLTKRNSVILPRKRYKALEFISSYRIIDTDDPTDIAYGRFKGEYIRQGKEEIATAYTYASYGGGTNWHTNFQPELGETAGVKNTTFTVGLILYASYPIGYWTLEFNPVTGQLSLEQVNYPTENKTIELSSLIVLGG